MYSLEDSIVRMLAENKNLRILGIRAPGSNALVCPDKLEKKLIDGYVEFRPEKGGGIVVEGRTIICRDVSYGEVTYLGAVLSRRADVIIAPKSVVDAHGGSWWRTSVLTSLTEDGTVYVLP